MENDAALHELAGAILDGDAIDWASAESGAADESLQMIIRDLRVIAAIAELHGSGPLEPPQHTLDISARGVPSTFGTWGTLRLVERVGQGAYGEVYRAWDMRLDREVALKLLPARLTEGDSKASSMIEEGRLLARVRHPNVVTIYGAERIESRVGLWMEFVRGRTLEQALQQNGPFSPAETIRIGIELCRAVSAVHGAGLLHRDIKTHNVMLADDGRVVLMDFGSGRELGNGTGQGLAGTPVYIAPELLRGEEAAARSDIYSVGVVLYRLLTGAYPVTARTLQDLRAAHQRGEQPDLKARRSDVPARLAQVVERALDADVERRYPRAADLLAELTALEPHAGARRLRPALAAIAALVFAGAGWQLLGSQLGSSVTPAALVSRIAGWNTVSAPAVIPVNHPAIAVLPFENLNSEPDSDYFVDGFTDELIRGFAVLEGLQVRSRTSSFAFKGRPRSVRQVGEQLGVNLVVEGSVLRAGGRVRINVQLVSVADDVPLWSDQFDRDLQDVFDILDEIPRAIVNRLGLTPGRGQRRYQTSVQAYDLYLRGRALVDLKGIPNLEKAVKLFEDAIARDRAFAPAHAGLANAYALMSAPQSSTLSFDTAHAAMRAAALKALELDPLLADAHLAMGWVHSRECDWENAGKAFRRAIDLDPALTQTYTAYSTSTLQPLGRLDEALKVLRLALRHDPLSLDLQREIGGVQLLAGRYEEAIETLERVRAADPGFPFARVFLGRALLFAGRLEEALPMLEGLDGNNLGRFKAAGARRGPWLAQAYVMAGRREEAQALVAEHAGSAPSLVIIHTALGDRRRALDALERVAATQPHHLGRMLLAPELAPLRGDSRVAALRKKFNLPAR